MLRLLCCVCFFANSVSVGAEPERASYLSTYAEIGFRTPDRIEALRWREVEIATFEFSSAGSGAPWALLTHGLFDDCGYMATLINHLEDRGFNVLCYDLPGHGLSDGAISDIGEFENYSKLLDAVLKERPYDWQLFAAHSTGSVSVYHPLTDPPFRNILLFAPLVLTQASLAVDVLARSTPETLDTLPRIFRGTTSSETFNDFHRNDAYQTDDIDLTWVRAWNRWQKSFRRLPALQISAEITVFQGDRDQVVDWVDNLSLLTQRFGQQLSTRMVPGAGHGLLNEAEPHRSLLLKHVDAVIRSDRH